MKIEDSARIDVTLELNVAEMRAILEATKDVSRWPMTSLRAVLSEAFSKASAAYYSDNVVE